VSHDSVAALQALTAVAEGAASFESRAGLEHHLLTLLREEGVEAVAALLSTLSGCSVTRSEDVGDGSARFAIHGLEAPLVITTHLTSASASVNVVAENPDAARVDPDPRHQAFYSIWESLLGLADSEVGGLDSNHRTVFLVALLEAEVMNGGLGQYLTNTDGVHVEATCECLLRVGAPKTAEVLRAAADLARGFHSYAAAWEKKSSAFSRLDQRFLDSREDLAGLTADALRLAVE